MSRLDTHSDMRDSDSTASILLRPMNLNELGSDLVQL